MTGGVVIATTDVSDSPSSCAKNKKVAVAVENLVALVNSESERILGCDLSGASVPGYNLYSPIRFCITGFKDVGAKKVETMEVLVQFIPEHLQDNKEVITCIINHSWRSINEYRSVDSFDLTELECKGGHLYIKLSYPCTRCKLEHVASGHDGVAKVGIMEVYNGLLAKNKYIGYPISCCESTAPPIGSVIFSRLKKPRTWLT